MGQKIDTRAIGLDVGLSFVRWLTGAENLHYGLWTGLEVSAGNLRAAQDAYTAKLFKLLPKRKRLRILDIGGGAGETAKKLLTLGHSVEIVVPSAHLAERCRFNAPEATVHEMTFEDYLAGSPGSGFDVCLFSESFQYIGLDDALGGAPRCLGPKGVIIVSDCFRTDAILRTGPGEREAGGGHLVDTFEAALKAHGLLARSREDVTEAVAPSIDLEQELFLVFGHAIDRIDSELSAKRRKTRWVLARLIRVFVKPYRLARLNQRLRERSRTAEGFAVHNRYLMLVLVLVRARSAVA